MACRSVAHNARKGIEISGTKSNPVIICPAHIGGFSRTEKWEQTKKIPRCPNWKHHA
ncbi:predicted protein [Botrytis cinerea T4]|uniref:Uncharacterized protein n=1 Tax=Botryotinia fuckeliana (strain T4) TaxID=999810 RepID=G2YPH7_BOTF4|nr:predicted protein [Botrytis cinerea T4]